MRLIVLEQQRFEKFSFFSDHPVLRLTRPARLTSRPSGANPAPHRPVSAPSTAPNLTASGDASNIYMLLDVLCRPRVEQGSLCRPPHRLAVGR